VCVSVGNLLASAIQRWPPWWPYADLVVVIDSGLKVWYQWLQPMHPLAYATAGNGGMMTMASAEVNVKQHQRPAVPLVMPC
jgi:hypothetical protein